MNSLISPKEQSHKSTTRAFTLIELLVVIAIIAIISVVVILVLNPAELLRQGRDSNRISDMQTLTTAIGVYAAGGGTSFGNSNTVYVSIPDPTATSTAGDQCQGLGLPSLPSAYSYHCAATSTVKNVDSTGWIPINFSSVALGSSLSQLPIDPINTSSTRNYYTYTTNGTQYEVTAPMESQKYKLGGSNDVIGPDGSTLSTVYAKGSNLSLEPLDYGDATLVGLWSFNEGTGTVAYDYSGSNATGTWNGTATGTSGYYSKGKIGPYAGTFDGTSTYINLGNPSLLQLSSAISVCAWVNLTIAPPSSGGYAIAGKWAANYPRTYTLAIGGSAQTWSGPVFFITTGAGGSVAFATSTMSAASMVGTWTFICGSYDGANVHMYVNGVAQGSAAYAGIFGYSESDNFTIGTHSDLEAYTNGLIDDVRVYNRALSAAEIAAMYNGGK